MNPPIAITMGDAAGIGPEIVAKAFRDHPDATLISAGMSGDLEDAIRFGATHVRVGSAILGNRPLSK